MEEIIIQEKLHEINAKVFRAKLPALTRLHGLKCDIFLPQPYQGNYDNDGRFLYNDLPNETTKFIVFNYFQLNQYSIEIFDPFTEQEKSILHTRKLIQNSKIKVYQGASYYEYRVNNFKVYNGKDGLILIENKLIPIT